MDKVNVKRSELLETLKKNRDNHRQIFLEASDGYRAAVIAELDAMLKDAREGRRIRRAVSLVEPTDQTREYDRAIRMLEMSQDEIIGLGETDFQQYVMDDWSWKRQFLASNASYSKMAADLQ